MCRRYHTWLALVIGVLLVTVGWGQNGFPPPERLTIQLTGGIAIKGILHAPRENKSLVIMLHSLGKTKESFASLGEYLVGQGMGVFSYDARGHGESTRQTKEQPYRLSYINFSRQGQHNEWNQMIKDLEEIVLYLQQKKGLATTSTAFVSSDIGANVALRYFASHPQVKTAVLLSPGLNYRDVRIGEAMTELRENPRPLLVVAARGDYYALHSCQQLERMANEKEPASWFRFLSLPGNAHGTELLTSSLINSITEWLQRHAQ